MRAKQIETRIARLKIALTRPAFKFRRGQIKVIIDRLERLLDKINHADKEEVPDEHQQLGK